MSAVIKPADIRSRVSPEEWEVRVQLAACYRLAAHYGWTDIIYTHISARVPGTEHYLLNPFGHMFQEITASSLLKVDLDGRKVEPSPHQIQQAGFVIHSAIHAARADAHCVLHSHTRAGMALSMLECGLLPLSQHAMLFYGNVAYHDSEGIALDVDERTRLARDLGDKKVMILRNHGTLVVGETVPQAFVAMWHLEKAMQAQLDAMATGARLTQPSQKVAEATAARGFVGRPEDNVGNVETPLGWYEWPALMRMLDRMDPSYKD
jgi:ribulose-5-phosphate 4-epimerase/fuculose-1-phosphate aldolase